MHAGAHTYRHWVDIYRTEGNGSVYYLVATITPTSATFEETTADNNADS
jgi:hypothetical protein